MKRPIITESHVAQINDLLIQNPDWNRSRLSVELCKLWGWQSPVGQIKDVSCRDMLRGLDKAGLISLPPRQRTGRITGRSSDKICIIEHNTEPIITELRNLTPLRIEIAASKEDIKTFKAYIAKYHYLSYGRSVGENMKYIIKSNTGVPIACIMFGSAAWRCKPRDEYIGWNDDERAIGLYYLTNNVRNIIFPWVRVPHLASHILGSVARRVSSDWQTKYGHPIYLLETFVEKCRFRGVSYRAANWVNVGETAGLGRNSKSLQPTLPIKDVWLYPLCANFRDKIRNLGGAHE